MKEISSKTNDMAWVNFFIDKTSFMQANGCQESSQVREFFAIT